MNGLRIQILPTISDLPGARKYQFAAFIAKEGILVVWDDDPLNVVARAKLIEDELMGLVWQDKEKVEAEAAREEKQMGIRVEEIIDEESGEVSGYREVRPTNLLNTILVAFTLALVITTLGAGYRQIGIEVAVDGNMLRLAFVALTPIQIFFTLVSISSSCFHKGALLGTFLRRFPNSREISFSGKLSWVALPNALGRYLS